MDGPLCRDGGGWGGGGGEGGQGEGVATWVCPAPKVLVFQTALVGNYV